MGKMKNILIQCIDNNQDPIYTLGQVAKHRMKYEKAKEGTQTKESRSKGTNNKPLVQVQKDTKP